jgi:hypothetical protein
LDGVGDWMALLIEWRWRLDGVGHVESVGQLVGPWIALVTRWRWLLAGSVTLLLLLALLPFLCYLVF